MNQSFILRGKKGVKVIFHHAALTGYVELKARIDVEKIGRALYCVILCVKSNCNWILIDDFCCNGTSKYLGYFVGW